MQAVHWSIEGDVAVIRLDKFSEQAFPGIQKAVNDIFAKRNGVAPKGIVFDIRNNPGGLVDQAVDVADAFLKQGAIVLTRSRLDAGKRPLRRQARCARRQARRHSHGGADQWRFGLGGRNPRRGAAGP